MRPVGRHVPPVDRPFPRRATTLRPVTPGDLVVLRLREAVASWAVGLALAVVDGEVLVMWSDLPGPTLAQHRPSALKAVRTAHPGTHE